MRHNAALTAFSFYCMLLPQAGTSPASPNEETVLSATETIHGMSTVEFLFARLKRNGQVEWELFENGKAEHRSSALTAGEFASILEQLNSVNTTNLPPTTGPYSIYTDSSAELRIQLSTPNGKKAFSMWNPWPCELPSCSLTKKKRMPPDVKSLFCAVTSVRSKISGEPLPAICIPRTPPKSKKPSL